MSGKEVYLIAGGRPAGVKNITEDFRAAFAACGKPNPRVAYVGAANADSRLFYRAMKIPIIKAGAGTVTPVSLARKDADAGKAKRILAGADAVFLSGGEVEDGIMWLDMSGLIGFLADLYRGGKLFIGLSAGAIMLGRCWAHWGAEGDDSTARLFSCLNFVPFIFDAHGENEDWAELRCVLRLSGPGAIGHGLSAGGFFSADENGCFSSCRNLPAVFRNASGEVERVGADE